MNLKELGHQSRKDVTFEVLLSSREKKKRPKLSFEAGTGGTSSVRHVAAS